MKLCILALCLGVCWAQSPARGVKIKSDQASVEFGVNGDVALRRKDGALAVQAKFLQATAYKVGDKSLAEYIIATVRAQIIPHIKMCEAGWQGPFCDQKCPKLPPGLLYSDGCKLKCQDGFTLNAANKCIAQAGLAKCTIKNSNMLPGKYCKCLPFFGGTITVKGNVVGGKCSACGQVSGFNGDVAVTKTVATSGKSTWTELAGFNKSNKNEELYENAGEFNNVLGRFYPKQTGYYVCNANVRLDGFSKTGFSRLVIAIKGRKDVNNGLHTIEGNGGSNNFRSMMVSGTLQIKKGEWASVFVLSNGDASFKIHDQSGFSCHQLATNLGFHAEKASSQKMSKAWSEITDWRVSGSPGLYSVGGGFNPATGRFTSPRAGVYYCYAMVRLDQAATTSYFRLNLNLNGKPDVNNGFHAIRGNRESSNFGSLNVAGTINLKQKDFVSVYAFANADTSWTVQTESGWGCHLLDTKIGFHADQSVSQTFSRTGWQRVTKWRTAGNQELYSMGPTGVVDGLFTAPWTAFYVCAAQVRIDLGRNDGGNYFRLVIGINGQTDVNNGMAVIDGDQGSSNYRTLRTAGVVKLTKNNKVGVYVFSAKDTHWILHRESGFSCHMLKSKPPCPACKIPNSNMRPGKACACAPGYSGKITWANGKPSGNCIAAPCKIANSNMKPGSDCVCKDGFAGKLVWAGTKVSGTCKPAPCTLPGSNKQPGAACKCKTNEFYFGKVVWHGAKATGGCAICGQNSGMNADLGQDIKVQVPKAQNANTPVGWKELTGWKTSGNQVVYETMQEFNNGNGRFSPKESGYYLCSANVRLDGFTQKGYSRLLIAIKGKRDINNGLHTIEGNGGSSTFRSMMVSGTVQIKKGEWASVWVFSYGDAAYTIKSDSGFSCHQFDTKYGFHADKSVTMALGKGRKEINNWRVAGTPGLYTVGGGFDGGSGRYKSQSGGVYFCAAMIRIDAASLTSYFRINLNLNGKADNNNGLAAIRGNMDSSNYGSLNIAGTIFLKRDAWISVWSFSSTDTDWRIHSESGWGCQKVGGRIGFHADMGKTTPYTKTGWNTLAGWSTKGNDELYQMGSPKDAIDAKGFYTAPMGGYYTCSAQVRIDAAANTAVTQGTKTQYSFFRLLIAINGQTDVQNGLGVIDGNRGSTNYRTLRVAGTAWLKQNDKVSVSLYSRQDKNFRVNSESGFSCHQFTSHLKECPACNIDGSNKISGTACKCLPGRAGKITWSGTQPSGKCTVSPCEVKNSNEAPGAACKCKDFYVGDVTWGEKGAEGRCIKCGPGRGFNSDLIKSIPVKKSGWVEINNWRTNSNNELYESDGSFMNGLGRFKPKEGGYFLCNANVRLDQFTDKAHSRLSIVLNGKPDVENGLTVIEGNGGSTNYRSMMVSGTVQIAKGQYASVFVQSSSTETQYTISTESGFSCHILYSPYGFHVDKKGSQAMTKLNSWVPVTKWRKEGALGLYNVNGGFNTDTGRYTVAKEGVYFCYAMLRLDGAASTKGHFFRMAVNLNGGFDQPNNGLHAIRGNGDSSNYGSLNVAGTVYLGAKDWVAVTVYSKMDKQWSVQSQSAWGCHRMGSNVGFHADASTPQTYRTGWSRVTKWSTKGNKMLYAKGYGNLGPNANGQYIIPVDGYYACATQVVLNQADNPKGGHFRVILSVNNGLDVNNGMHAIDGDGGGTDSRTLRVAGVLSLKKGNSVSVSVYSRLDASWKLSSNSGFSCNKMWSRPPCPVCNIPNSNRMRGLDCACKGGYTGKITWKNNKPSGLCTPIKCPTTIANTNKKAGSACACADGYTGQIKWKGTTASGSCKPAPCNVPNSNKKPGPACKCQAPYSGIIGWVGALAYGTCAPCGINSGFNADLTKDIKVTVSTKSAWKELTGWRTSQNSELYESNKEFGNVNGRFLPQEGGYYLCNANVRLDGFTNAGYSRLVIAVKGNRDVNNGLHTIEGNGGSTNYRSMMVSGTLQIKKGEWASVWVMSFGDAAFTIKSDSGFSCHQFDTKVGFHAEKNGHQIIAKTNWVEITKWRVAGTPGLYSVGGKSPTGFNTANGRYVAPVSGVYFCYAMVRMDQADKSSYFRLNMNLNGGKDVNNGFHAIRGNGDSSNYGSLNVAGTVYLNAKQWMSVYAFSSSDKSWRVQTESGWGCHMMGTRVGFHADVSATKTITKVGWSRVVAWRTAGNNELYAFGGGPNTQGYYTAPQGGFYVCAAQVRIDAAAKTIANTANYFRMTMAINGQADTQSGLGVIDGNQGSTNYRTMRTAGTIYLKPGNKVSVHIYSQRDNNWRIHSESGFSCHKFVTHGKKCANNGNDPVVGGR